MAWPLLLMFLMVVVSLWWSADVASAATITVNDTSDPIGAGGGCTLRRAVLSVNNAADFAPCVADVAQPYGTNDTIIVPAGTYVLTNSGAEDFGLTGDLDVLHSVTITGAGARTTIVDGDQASSEDRVFDIGPLPPLVPPFDSPNVTISGLTITNGGASNSAGDVGGGARVASGSSLTLIDSIVRDNFASVAGAGISSEGDLTVIRSLVTGNQIVDAGGDGGGIALLGGANKIVNSTISGNSADDKGGGLYVEFGVNLVSHTTFVGNTAPGGGGAVYLQAGLLDLRANIYSTSTPGNCAAAGGTQTSRGSNLSTDGTCGGHATDQTNVSNLNLGPLANNGGPTNTFALQPSSAAIDAVQGSCTEDGTGGGTTVSTDQRGTARPKDGNADGTPTCDVGAFEAVAPGVLQFSAPTYSVAENAGTAAITVTRTNGSEGTVGATVSLSDGTATAPADYDASARTVSFGDGDTTPKTVNIPIVNDALDEADETVSLSLGSPTGGAGIGTPSTATLTIQDDDATPTLSINDVAVTEGNSGTTNATFTVTLSAATSLTVTVQAQTADGTATVGSDYTATGPTTLTFSPGGALTQTFTVPVIGDTLDEPNETFVVNLTSGSNATIADAQGVGTIADDDGAPSLSIADVSLAEGNSGTRAFVFTVSLLPPSAQQVTVVAQTADGTATAGSDYAATGPTTLTFAAGATSQSFSVPVTGDIISEPDETFVVNLSGAVNATISDAQATGTIVNDDAQPTLAINDVSQPEGNSGTTSFTFTVTLTGTTGQAVTVAAQTADGTATSGSDYTAVGPVTLTFAPGTATQTVSVPVTGDTVKEPDETFTVRLSAPVNAAIADGEGLGTIRNDDADANVSPEGGENKDDSPKPLTEEQRQQHQLTNASNRDDVSVEGNVVEVNTDEEPPYVVIANRDGLVKVVLYKDAAKVAGGIRVGDYLEADGEKQHEFLFDAYDVSIKR